MSTVNNTKDRTPLKDFFFYEITIDNGVVDIHAYPIFDQDISSRANLDTKHSVHLRLPNSAELDDEEDTKIADVAYMEEDFVTDFGFSGQYLWDGFYEALDELGRQLRAKDRI